MLDLHVGAINHFILQSKKLKADKYFAKRQKNLSIKLMEYQQQSISNSNNNAKLPSSFEARNYLSF